MSKKGIHRGSVKDGGAETSRRAIAPRLQPWLTPRQSPSLRTRQSPSAIALFLSKKEKGKHARREAAGVTRARRVPNATSGCNRLGSAVFTLAELRRITNDFSDDQLIGEGAFGKVYKGVLTNGDVIAVKRFASTITGLQDGQYENEAQHLTRLEHPNIVQLVGYCSETERKLVWHNGTIVRAEETERLLCLEYMPKKSLRGHLSDETSGLEWNTRYKIIEGICYGLHYLHEEWQATPIIHMDLKPANILLDDNMVPKIADFGLSRLFGEEQTRTCTRSCKGTPGYMAPEYLEKGVITKKFDIFSLGVIIIEIITGDKVYPQEETETATQQYIDTVLSNWTHRLRKTQGHISQDIDYQQINKCIQIGLLCVKFDGAKRPTINQIIEMLERSDEACKHERETPEEAAKALTSSLSSAPSLCRTLVDQNQPPRYKLSFENGLDTEVFVNKVICDIDGWPLMIRVLANDLYGIDAHILNAKIEVVVLHGDFNIHNQECWNREEFSNSIVRPEHEFGVRVILTGELQLRLTNGEANLRGATFIESSWLARNGRFRLGVMVTDDLSERVQEGITKPFVVEEAAAVPATAAPAPAMPGEASKALTSSLWAPAMANYLASDEQIDLFHELQKFETETYGYLMSPTFMSASYGTSTIADALNGTPSLCRTLVDQNQPPRYKLSFVNCLDTEVFVNKVICDIDGEPLKIRALANDQDEIDAHILNAKIQVVLLHANFKRRNHGCWTREEFSNSIVHPEEFGLILTGKLQLCLTNGEANLRGATFIESSGLERNGRFRLGVMVTDNNLSERVQEGITRPFVVQEAAAAAVENPFGDKLARPVRRSMPSSSLSSAVAMTSGSDGDTESDADTHRREKRRLSNGKLARLLSYRKSAGMLSNRESARRSRKRKQQHLNELKQELARLQAEKPRMAVRAANIASQCARVKQENTVLHVRAAELRDRLRSLNEVLRVVRESSGVAMDIQEEMMPADDPAATMPIGDPHMLH